MTSELLQNAEEYDTRPFPTHAAIVAYWIQHAADVKLDFDVTCPKCWACGQDWNNRFAASKQAMSSSRFSPHWERAPLQRCHIVPRKLGGSNDASNLFLMCAECHDIAPNITDRSLFFEWTRSQDYSTRREKKLRQAFHDFDLDFENLSVQRALLKALRSSAFKSWISENTLCHWPQDKKCGSRLTESTVVAAFIAFRRRQPECLQDSDEHPDGGSGKLIATILAEISINERLSHRERQTTRFEAMRLKREIRAHAPYGWKCESLQKREGCFGTAPKRLIPHAEEQAGLVRIFELISLKQSTTQVAKFLNRHGIKTKGNPRYLRGGLPVESKGIWYPSTVQSVLEHSTLIDGTYCEVTNKGGRLFYHMIRPSNSLICLANATLI